MWGVRSLIEIEGTPTAFDFADRYRYAALALVIVGPIFGLAGNVAVGRKDGLFWLCLEY